MAQSYKSINTPEYPNFDTLQNHNISSLSEMQQQWDITSQHIQFTDENLIITGISDFHAFLLFHKDDLSIYFTNGKANEIVDILVYLFGDLNKSEQIHICTLDLIQFILSNAETTIENDRLFRLAEYCTHFFSLGISKLSVEILKFIIKITPKFPIFLEMIHQVNFLTLISQIPPDAVSQFSNKKDYFRNECIVLDLLTNGITEPIDHFLSFEKIFIYSKEIDDPISIHHILSLLSKFFPFLSNDQHFDLMDFYFSILNQPQDESLQSLLDFWESCDEQVLANSFYTSEIISIAISHLTHRNKNSKTRTKLFRYFNHFLDPCDFHRMQDVIFIAIQYAPTCFFSEGLEILKLFNNAIYQGDNLLFAIENGMLDTLPHLCDANEYCTKMIIKILHKAKFYCHDLFSLPIYEEIEAIINDELNNLQCCIPLYDILQFQKLPPPECEDFFNYICNEA